VSDKQVERIKANLFHAGKPRLSVFNWIRLFFFFSFGAVGVLLPYLGLLLSEKGISGVQLGSLLGLIPLVQIFVQPLWGYLAGLFGEIQHIAQVTLAVHQRPGQKSSHQAAQKQNSPNTGQAP